MCGINGFITTVNKDTDLLVEKINKMNNLIFHRGPDDDGVYTHNDRDYSIAMGMRRLSIIDLHSGKQPIASEDGKITIVFNGEIYNYLQLKKELQNKNIEFKTTSDTEVILKLYELEGASSFAKLDGMFGFSIHDKRKNKIFIARDFFGEKPLYYSNLNNTFSWASELKSIVNIFGENLKISKTGLNHYFRLTYVPAPHTIYEGINKLEANHYITYDLTTKDYIITSISNDVKIELNTDISFKEAKDKTKELVYDSVESRSISDVPLGTWLSGGVDSSIVSLCLSQIKDTKIDTFSIGFKKQSFDETDKSQVVAKMINSNHHEFIIGEDDLKDNIHNILVNFDEPFSDTAALPTDTVSNMTSNYVKVALTGDGGDEIFGGYTKYYVGKLNSRYTSIIPKRLHKSILKYVSPVLQSNMERGRLFQINKMLNSVNYDGDFYWDIISLGNTENQLKKLLKEDNFKDNLFEEYKSRINIDKPKTIHDFRFVDYVLSLEGGMLAKVDRTSMLNSLECRAPFLNKKIWDFTASLPEKFLMNGWDKKHILKKAFEDQFPKDFLEKGKRGFGSPVGDWLRSSLREELESYIDIKFLESQNLFNIDVIVPLVKNHLAKKQDNTFRVWSFYCFQKWYKFNYLKFAN